MAAPAEEAEAPPPEETPPAEPAAEAEAQPAAEGGDEASPGEEAPAAERKHLTVQTLPNAITSIFALLYDGWGLALSQRPHSFGVFLKS